MKKQPFFSITMPVYNSEGYLSKAIESILNQTFTDFELILVEDDSNDNSYVICAKYASKDDRIILKRTAEHLGVANVRNEGLKWISGKYLTFVDSDDFIDNDLLEIVQKKLSEHKVQVLKYGCIEEYYTSEGTLAGSKEIALREQYITNITEIRRHILEIEQMPLFGYLWNSFYDIKALKIKERRFDLEYEVNEDFMFNLNIFDDVEYLYCLNNCGYHYAKRVSNSLSTKKNSKYYSLHMAKINNLIKKYEKWCLLNNIVLQNIFWLYTRYIYSAIARSIKENTVRNIFLFLDEIFESELFLQYRTVNFSDALFKQRILVNVLKSRKKFLIILMCGCISFVKNHFRLMFARIKR
ncbi:glycosyltransferase family 2 protein [Pectinatus haikarae]|uniref:glycosyltransferase family 2 protein n=1 Tax=Pectinatus haikarae TaxID=349096 RepID=UPI001E50524C|nr:glycosyltransferase [Pectinatus haikarae]